MRSFRLRNRLAIEAAFAVVLGVSGSKMFAAEPIVSDESGQIEVHVLDAAGEAQDGASVSFSAYDSESRTFKGLSSDSISDRSGIVRLERLATDKAYYIVRAHTRDGLVGYRGCSPNGNGTRQEIDVTVLRPAVVTLHIRDESGKPVSSAAIWSILHRGVNGEIALIDPKLFRALGLSANRSNDAGELRLPELPGGKIDVKLIHPDYAPCELKGIVVEEKVVAEATLPRGVKLTFKIEMDGKPPPFKGLEFTIQHELDDHPSSLSGPLPELRPDGTAQLTVAAGKYSRLAVYHWGHIITPVYTELPDAV